MSKTVPRTQITAEEKMCYPRRQRRRCWSCCACACKRNLSAVEWRLAYHGIHNSMDGKFRSVVIEQEMARAGGRSGPGEGRGVGRTATPADGPQGAAHVADGTAEKFEPRVPGVQLNGYAALA